MVSPEGLPRPDSEREENLGRLWEAIASAADHAATLEEASQECLDAVCSLTGWPVGHLYVVAGDEVVSTKVWHLDDPEQFSALRQATASTTLAVGRGLPGEVVASGRAVWIADVTHHPNFPRRAAANDLGVRSGFAFPILLDTEVVAVLEFFSPDLTSLDQALLDLVARVGNQLSRVVERQRAAEQLASSDERLRRILDTANESFISMDADGKITEWNQCAESTFGWLRHEVLGRPLDEVLIPERHREAHRRGLERFLASGEGKVVGTTVELTALHRRGYEIPVELAIWAFGESTGWTFNGLIRDISGRKESEERLRASERRLAEAQQVAGVGSWEWQLVTDTVVWSDELYRLYGLIPGSFEITYETFLSLVDERDRLRVVDMLVASKANGKPFEFDHRITRPDGRLRVLHAKGEVLFDNGQAIRMRGTARDVTERRHAEEELRRLRAALESAVKGMAQVNRQGRYTSVNDGYAAMCGRHPEEMIGLPWMDVVHAADHEKASAGYRSMLNDDRAVFEVAGARPDGSHFEQRMVLVKTSDGDEEFIGHVCCMQDITARRQAETEQRAMLEWEREMVKQLTQLDREKTDFISCVSHELRTPLTSMLGFLELLTGGEVGSFNPDQDQMLEVVDRNARRLLSRVDDLLTVSQHEAGAFPLTLGPVTLDGLVTAAVATMAPALTLRQLELVLEVADDAGTITGDVDQLDRVLLNLLSNAVKFTPVGGRVSLRVRREESSVEIVVADNGMGVPEEEQPRLFQRFFRSSAATEMAIPGTGLGLVIIRRIVEQHHGQIRLRSSPDVGTEVTVTLPVDLLTVASGSQESDSPAPSDTLALQPSQAC